MFFDNDNDKTSFQCTRQAAVGTVCPQSIFGSGDLGVFSAPHGPPLKCLSSGPEMDLCAEEEERHLWGPLCRRKGTALSST